MRATIRFALLDRFRCFSPGRPLRERSKWIPVDLELVIAVDVSRSMDEDEFRLQRSGYVEAIRDPSFIRGGDLRRVKGGIALTYVEWSGLPSRRSWCRGG